MIDGVAVAAITWFGIALFAAGMLTWHLAIKPELHQRYLKGFDVGYKAGFRNGCDDTIQLLTEIVEEQVGKADG